MLAHYVPGEENALAHAAFVRLAVNPAVVPSPVLLVGPPGSGKSHLLEGLFQAWRQSELPLDARRMDAATLTLAHQRAQLERTMAALEAELADLPALIVDDVHELAGRASTEQLLRRVIDQGAARGRVLVFASRAHPASTGMSPALAGRLVQGIVLPLALPSIATRAVLVRRTLLAHGVVLAPVLARRLAEALPDPSAIARATILLERLARRVTIGRAHVDAAIAELVGTRPTRPATAEAALNAIETALELAPGSLATRRGPRRLERHRRLAMRIGRDLGFPRPAVAHAMSVQVGSLDAALRRLAQDLANDPALAAELTRLRAALGLA